MVGNGQLVSMLKDGQLKEWVDAEALAQWVNPGKLRELGVDVEDLDELATYLTETAAEELPGALEKGAEFLQAARENKQAQALLTKAKELMSSGNASQDINKLLSWSKEASKEELVETVKNRVRRKRSVCVQRVLQLAGLTVFGASGAGLSPGSTPRNRSAPH